MPSRGPAIAVSMVLLAMLGAAVGGTALVGSSSWGEGDVGKNISNSTRPLSGAESGGPIDDAAGAARHRLQDGPPGISPTAITPYRVHTGAIDYVAAGAAMRNQGYGTISLSWPGSLVAAYLVWGFMNGDTPTYGTLNGVPIMGTVFASNPGNPCWDSMIHTLVADVTPYVVNGPNALTGFPSGVTTGDDPWGGGPRLLPYMEGASLVVIYTSLVPQRQITLYLSVDTSLGGALTNDLVHMAAQSPSAQTTFVVSDGQLPGNTAYWNGGLVDGNAFPGADPKAAPQPWSYGTLWDTRTYPVTVMLGSPLENAMISGSGGDCLTWHAQVLRVDGSPLPPNTPPTLFWTAETGYEFEGLEPELGMTFTTFTYRVVYADADGDSPTMLEILIDKPRGSSWGTFTASFVGWLGVAGDYVAGALFEFSTSLPLGTDYWYSFQASDGRDLATGAPTGWIDAPDVIADDPPTAVARAFPTVTYMGETVLFDGTASTDDFGIVAYLWEFGGGVEDSNAISSHVYSARGTFTALLTVWDAIGQSDTDGVAIDVENRQPIADAGPASAVFKKTIVTLNGGGSSDPDGDALTFAWSQTGGPTPLILSGADTATPTLTPPRTGTYAFALTVSDGWGGESSDTVTVVASNRPPLAIAGPDRTLAKKAVVTLAGSGSDPDGDLLAFTWTQIGGTVVALVAADSPSPTFVPFTSGDYAFRLTVDDGDGGTASDEVSITATNAPPAADAGADRTGGKNVVVSLDGSRSSDPDQDPLAFAWTQTDGPATSLVAPTSSTPWFTPAAMGTYTFELLVDDGDGGTSVDSVAVVVTGLPPVARLSANPVEAEVGQAISFDGSGSTDPDGVIVDFAFAFGDETTAAGQEAGPRHAYAEVGTFEVTLTVTDDDGNTDSASLSVTVSEPPTRQIAVDVNWKPLVAGIFAAILLVVGVRASRRSSGGPGGTRRFAGLAFATTSLPFVLAEVATGVLSYFTGLLAIPPIVGLGLAVDVVILGVGVGVAVWKSRQSVTAARRKETGA